MPSPDPAVYARPASRRPLVLLACGAATGILMAGYGLFTAKGTRSGGIPPEAIATVNGRPVLRSDFMAQVQSQYSLPYGQSTPAQRQKVLADMVDEELLVQRGLEMDLPSYDPDVRNALVAGVDLEVTADARSEEPTTAELRAYYDAHRDAYSSEGVLRLRDLVIGRADPRQALRTDRVARAAVAALRSGEAVDSVMRRYGLVDSGRFMDAGHVDLGDLYQFSVRAKLSDALYNAAIALRAGEVSEPVEDTDGVHVIVVSSHKFPVPQAFDEARSRVWTDLKDASQARARSANLRYLHGRAAIQLPADLRR